MMIIFYRDLLTLDKLINSMLNRICLFEDRCATYSPATYLQHENGWYHDVNFVKSLGLSLDGLNNVPGRKIHMYKSKEVR